jgi:hypothetical protein
MIAEFYKVLLTLYYISHLSCQRQLTTKWKLGLSIKDFRPLGIEIELLIDHITVVVLYLLNKNLLSVIK